MLNEPRSHQPASWREWGLVLGAAFLFLLVLTWPLVPALGSAARLDSGDGRLSVWNVGWVAHALITSPTHLLDANIFWPHRGTLAFSEMNLVAGLLGLPAYLVAHNAVAAHNFAVVIGLMLTAVATWLLVRRLTGSSGAAFVSAVLFTFCSFIDGHTAHVQLLMTFGVPLALLAFHRLRDAPTVGRALALGAALTVAGLACGYYGIYGGLLVGFGAVVLARPVRAYWLALFGAAATAAVLVLPFVVPYTRARDGVDKIETARTDPGLQISAVASDYLASPVILENMIVPAAWSPPAPHEFLSPGLLGSGLCLLGAIVGFRKRRAGAQGASDWRMLGAYAVMTALAVWASLGPTYGLYGLFMRVVPGIGFLRAPCRFGIDVALGVAVMAGFGARALLEGRRWVLIPLLFVCALDRYVGPWPLQTAPIPTVYRVLATLPKGVVVDYPFPYVLNDLHNHTHAMYYSTADWMPRVNGYSDIIPVDFLDIAGPINAFPELPSFALLHHYQVRYVVWRLADYKRGSVVFDTLANRFPAAQPYLRPIYRDNDFWLYEIVGWPPESTQ